MSSEPVACVVRKVLAGAGKLQCTDARAWIVRQCVPWTTWNRCIRLDLDTRFERDGYDLMGTPESLPSSMRLRPSLTPPCLSRLRTAPRLTGRAMLMARHQASTRFLNHDLYILLKFHCTWETVCLNITSASKPALSTIHYATFCRTLIQPSQD